jgi:hypothetical protein
LNLSKSFNRSIVNCESDERNTDATMQRFTM